MKYHSKGDFPDDTFTESDVLRCLDTAGKRYKLGSRYILAQCPTHEDENPSVQIYKDDWFVNCHAGCGRFHITKAFPELRQNMDGSYARSQAPVPVRTKTVTEHKYTDYNQYEFWESLPLIPRDHEFKTIPLDVLDSLGWRWLEDKNSYYIPYFDRSQQFIPFSQMRHLQGDRRFTFLKDAKPIAYGLWNLDPSNSPLFICEGASDAAVLDYCAVPWLAMPSAASVELIKGLGRFCKKEGIQLVYAGDNDAAGDKLRDALDEVTSYRVKQPPKKYKDWGDFLVATDLETVQNYCFEELFPEDSMKLPPEKTWEEMNDVEKVQEVFPGAVQLEIVNDPSEDSKELSKGSPQPLF